MLERSDHIVICGNSNLPLNILNEIFREKPVTAFNLRTIRPPQSYNYVVISDDKEIVKSCHENFPKVESVLADATDDDVLAQYSMDTAHAVIISYADDRENLLITFSVRQLNPDIFILVTSSEIETMQPKLIRAGANSVISSSNIGGMRMAATLIRPVATEFLDKFLFNQDNDYTVEELIITEADPNKNKKISESEYAANNLLIIAISRDDTHKINYNPSSRYHLKKSDIILVLGHTTDFKKLSFLTHYGQFSKNYRHVF